MKNRITTRNLTLLGLLAGIMVLFGLLPNIFYIPTPWGIQITLMCLPVIIGTLILGLRTGFYLGLIFGITSIAQFFIYGNPLLAPLFYSPQNWFEPVLFIGIILIPRMAVGPITYLVSRCLKTKYNKLNLGIASAIGSITNTVGFLGLFYLLFGSRLDAIIATSGQNLGINFGSSAPYLLFLASTNGVLEAIVAVVACIPIVVALKKSYKQETIGE